MSNSSTSLEITSPGGGAPLGEVELTPVGQVSAIVGAACKAQPEWSRRTVADRAALLEVAADLLDPQSEELSLLLASEAGKPRRAAPPGGACCPQRASKVLTAISYTRAASHSA